MRAAQHILLAAGVSIAGLSSPIPPAQAQTPSPNDIGRCTAIAADRERLACYDRLLRTNALPGQEPATAPPEHVDQSFGMVKPATTKALEPSRMEAKVLTIATDSRGVVVQLDNDQTWAPDDATVMLRAGDAVVIKRAALGSFLMTTPTHRVYRVRRLR